MESSLSVTMDKISAGEAVQSVLCCDGNGLLLDSRAMDDGERRAGAVTAILAAAQELFVGESVVVTLESDKSKVHLHSTQDISLAVYKSL